MPARLGTGMEPRDRLRFIGAGPSRGSKVETCLKCGINQASGTALALRGKLCVWKKRYTRSAADSRQAKKHRSLIVDSCGGGWGVQITGKRGATQEGTNFKRNKEEGDRSMI